MAPGDGSQTVVAPLSDVDEEALRTCSSPNGAAEKSAAPVVLSRALEGRSGAAANEEPTMCGVSLKYVSLVLLTVQTTGQVLLIKWAQNAPGPKYLSSTVVCFTEVLKAVVSVVLVMCESEDILAGVDTLRTHFTQDIVELLKAAVPSLIYTVQNNLMFYSLDKLSGAVQQVLYQMKTLTTAGLAVIMLGQSLSKTRWFALVLLVIGIAIVQWPRDQAVALQGSVSDQTKGFFAVVAACFTSGFAGVYIQKMLQQTTASIWVRNVQLGLFGAIMGLIVAMAKDGAAIAADGFCQGYNFRVICVIFMNALGGLLCAVMLKYAGATLGCFSTALSIVLTCACSAVSAKDDFVLDQGFVVGTVLTVWATLLYGIGLPAWVLELVGRK